MSEFLSVMAMRFPFARVFFAERRKRAPRLALRDQEMLFRRLAMLLRGGVALLDALRMLEKQASSPVAARIAAQAASDVERGAPLAGSLAAHGGIFDELTLAVIGIGELSGTLAENLEHVAVELKKRRALRRAVAGAAAYPAFVLAVTLGITTFLAAYVFPKIVPVFRSIGADLPFTTRVMLAVSDALLRHPLLFLLAAAAAVAGTMLALRDARVRLARDRWTLRLPVVGALVRGCAIANVCRAFGLLMGSGESIVEASRVAAGAAGNLAYAAALHDFGGALASGEPVSACFAARADLFPPVVAHLAEAGERAGTLQGTFRYLAAMHEEEVDEIAKNLGPALEPVLLLTMGLVVGFVALSIITPIYGLTQHIAGS